MGGRGWPGGAGCPPPLLFRAVYRVACRAVALCGSSSASQAAKDEPGTTASHHGRVSVGPFHRDRPRDSGQGAVRLRLCLAGGKGRASHHGSDRPDTGPHSRLRPACLRGALPQGRRCRLCQAASLRGGCLASPVSGSSRRRVVRVDRARATREGGLSPRQRRAGHRRLPLWGPSTGKRQ